jgi:hypothetical protein
MDFLAVVTFESTTQPPRVYQGEIAAGSAQSAASKAIRAARKAHKKAQWSSMVVVLMKDRT